MSGDGPSKGVNGAWHPGEGSGCRVLSTAVTGIGGRQIVARQGKNWGMEMATQTTVRLVDDLDGSAATETIKFGVDGKAFEIDLNADNAARLRGALEEFRKAARVVTRRAGRAELHSVPNTGSSGRKRAPRGAAKDKRAWLAANGHDVAGKRGRFTAEQEAAWAAHQAGAGAPQEGTTVTARKRGGTERKETVEAPQEPQEAEESPDAAAPAGKRTRVTALSGAQVSVLKEFTSLVIESGASWALLEGAPADVISAVEAVRANTVFENVGDKRALAFVLKKVYGGKGVKVLEPAA